MSGLDVDTRTDIYSLGVLRYELLTGRTPVDQETLRRVGLDEMRRIIREHEPAKPSTAPQTLAVETRLTVALSRQCDAGKLTAPLRGDLDWIVMKAIEKDRTRRYETANGLALDIKRHLENEPVLARPPSTLYRVRRMVTRNKLAFSAGASVALAILVALVVLVLSTTRIRSERLKRIARSWRKAPPWRMRRRMREKPKVNSSMPCSSAPARDASVGGWVSVSRASKLLLKQPGFILMKGFATRPRSPWPCQTSAPARPGIWSMVRLSIGPIPFPQPRTLRE